MKIEIFKIESKENKEYLELLELYKSNSEVQTMLNKPIFDSEMIWAGDFRLITMLKRAIDIDDINVYLVKETDDNVFVWVIGEFIDDKKISMYPLLKEQSEDLQLEIRRVLIEKGLMKESEKKAG